MITFIYDLKEYTIESKEDIFIFARSSSRNVFYNEIADPASGKSCYPDMIIKHDLSEVSVFDHELYLTAMDAQKKYGTSKCFFMELTDSSIIYNYTNMIIKACSLTELTLSDSDLLLVTQMEKDLCLSDTMKNTFVYMMTYYSSENNIQALFNIIRKNYQLPVTTKREGKIIYDRIRAIILK